MARARNIKPGFYKNEDLAECSVWARLIFPGLWMLADREGRLEDRPKRIKGELLPYDAIEIDPLLDELVRYGFIQRYEVAGVKCIQIAKFTEHQTPHVREQASTIPAPPNKEQSTTKAVPSTNLGSDEASPRSPDSLNPSSLNPDCLIVEEKHVASLPRISAEPIEQVFNHWKTVMDHPRSILDDKRKKLIGARLKDGYTVDDLKAAVDGCKASPFHMGENDQRSVHDGIDLICRDATHVDKFLAKARGDPDAGKLSAAGRQTAQNMKRWLEKSDAEDRQDEVFISSAGNG